MCRLAPEKHLAVVIEDDDTVREMMCELLESAGFRVAGCRNGEDGIMAARELRPSVVTLDLHMPGIDGVEVLRRLNSDESTADLPVVVVSAYSYDRRLGCWSQVKAVLSKPFDLDDLCAKVRAAAGMD